MSDVIEALQNIIVKQLVGDPNKQVPKRKKVDENVAEVHRGPTFQFAYYFTTEDTHHAIIHRNPTFSFPEVEDDQQDEDVKPDLHVIYKELIMYPEQVVLVVEPYDPETEPEFFGFQYKHTITQYLSNAPSAAAASSSK
ncbi:unnamed protein product [Umbelopsis sp. WA50703]